MQAGARLLFRLRKSSSTPTQGFHSPNTLQLNGPSSGLASSSSQSPTEVRELVMTLAYLISRTVIKSKIFSWRPTSRAALLHSLKTLRTLEAPFLSSYSFSTTSKVLSGQLSWSTFDLASLMIMKCSIF